MSFPGIYSISRSDAFLFTYIRRWGMGDDGWIGKGIDANNKK